MTVTVAAACSGLREPERSAPTTTSTAAAEARPAPTPAAPSDPSGEALDRVTALGGRLAIVAGPTVVVTRPDGSNATTVDGGEAGGGGAVAGQPAWSRGGGRLAWSRTTAAGHSLVVGDLTDGTELVSDAPGPPSFYLQWSGDDSTIASLRNAPAGGGIELGTATPGDAMVPVAVSAPFYVSWAPTEAVLATHVASTQVVLVPGRPGAGIGGGVLVERSGPFTAPAWLDDASVAAVGPDGLTRFDVAGGQDHVLVEATEPIRFVVSPDRARIAYQVEGPTGGPSAVALPVRPAAGLVVLDLTTEEQTVVTADLALAWEWSPDGDRLAWLSASPGVSPDTVRWQFWDGQETTASMPYLPSGTMVATYLPFFEQYAQSTTGWSPDGAAFAFAGRPRPSDDDGIWVQPMGVDGSPVRVADGEAVTWGR